MIGEMTNWIIIFAIVLFTPFLAMNFLTNGFILVYLSVLTSRGKKTLVKVESISGAYFRAGHIVDSAISFKVRHPEKKQRPRTIILKRGCVSRLMNVAYIEVDEETNGIVSIDKTLISGHDANKYDSMMQRIAMLPSLDDKKQLIIFALMFIIIVAIVGANAYFSYTLQEKMVELVAKVGVL